VALGGDLIAHGRAKNRIVLDQQNSHGSDPVNC
jgi:hypothetical protein